MSRSGRAYRHPRRRFEPPAGGIPITTRLAVRCSCGKVWTSSEEDARVLHRSVAQHTANPQPVRFYRCNHEGRWHWTSQLEHASPSERPTLLELLPPEMREALSS